MEVEIAIQQLEKEWDRINPGGFFGEIYNNQVLDKDALERVKHILRTVKVPKDTSLDRRLVEVTWFIPVFLFWQREAWQQDGKDTTELDAEISTLGDMITRILGLP